jgi:phosphoglycolate phosphatase-like HAD superfamily hydrolase
MVMPSYEHVLFDFDGVLCDSLDAAMAEFNALATGEFPALPVVGGPDDMVTVYGGSLRTCLSSWLDAADHRRFFDAHSAAMAARAAGGGLRLFPGIDALLTALPPGSASIVTSAYSDAVRAMLAPDGVLPSAIGVIAGRERRQIKTDKIRDVLAEGGLRVDQALYAGDLESDVLYCRDVPIDMVAVSYGYHPAWHLETCRPAYLVDDVAALTALLGRVLAPVANSAKTC